MGMLGHRGTGRAAGPRAGWPRSCAAAGRSRTPPGRRCRREVCPEGEVCCPPSHPRRDASSTCLVQRERRGVGGPKLNYLACVGRKAERRWLTRSGDKNKENTLRKNETSSLSMRQLCPPAAQQPHQTVHCDDRNGPSPSGNG